MKKATLTKKHVHDFLSKHRLMAVATYGDFPWIATVYYSFDKNLNLYFLSSPTTIHCKQIAKNEKVAVSIADSHQDVHKPKRGLQLSGIAKQISDVAKIKHALHLWKSTLGVENKSLSYENMLGKVIKGRMYIVKPKRIKVFDQELFKVEDGEEPVMNM